MIGKIAKTDYLDVMPSLAPATTMPVKVVEIAGLMGGQPCIAGTRVLAETIRQYLIDGYSPEEIFDDYPYLPVGAIEAVQRWAKRRGLACSNS